MIQKLFNNPHLIHQTPDSTDSLPEPTIAVCRDNSGLIIVSQEGRDIVMNRGSVRELSTLLKEMSSEK